MKDIELQAERAAFEAWWDASEDIDNAGPWTPDSPIQFAWAAWRAAVEVDRAQKAPDGKVLVDRGVINMVINALRRDAEQGRSIRGEMADALLASTPAPAAQEPT